MSLLPGFEQDSLWTVHPTGAPSSAGCVLGPLGTATDGGLTGGSVSPAEVRAMSDRSPTEYRCSICGDPSVNPHRDSLCAAHYPGKPPDRERPDKRSSGLSNRPASVAAARAVAGPEPATASTDPDAGRHALIDRLTAKTSEPDTAPETPDAAAQASPTDPSDETISDADTDTGAGDDSFLAAAMGDSEAAESYTDDQDDELPGDLQPTSSATSGTAIPTGALPLSQLDAISPEQRRRAARKRGMEWPTTEQARDRLEETIQEIMRHEDDRVVDAPTSLGKTYTIASTRWGAREDVTGGRPVVHLLETRDARDEAIEVAEEHGGEYMVLRSRHEACPVAAGDYDPPGDADETESAHDSITMDGEPASEWLDRMCNSATKGLPFSAAHQRLATANDQDRELPCCEQGKCPAIAQWERYREGEHPLVIATHNFAYAPGLRMHNNLVIDEEPDYVQELSKDRVESAVAAYLRHVDAHVKTWEAFIQLARHEAYGDDAANERAALESDLDAEPDREWYFEDADAHILAPALARAVFHAEERANNRRVGKESYEPPRLEANARDEDAWNRELVSVVLDESNDVRSVRVVPYLQSARSVVGLDAHPALPKWQANTVPWIQDRAVLAPDERRLWRRYERGLRVVQVGDATRPLASGEYFDRLGTEALLEQLVETYGLNSVRTLITAKSVEGEAQEIMREIGIREPETMHFGEEKSRNDFATEDIGVTLGSIDPGDGHILDLLAELDLEAEPERSDPEDCDDPSNAECDHCDGEGCYECLGTGLKRKQGRAFVGEDADEAAAILASVRENHTAQAAGRYARHPEDPGDTATVFVRTDAIPPGFADVQVPGVAYTFSEKQDRVVEALRESRTSRTAREIADETDVSKEHVRKTFTKLAEAGKVDAVEGEGKHGATLYSDDGLPTQGVADVTGEDGEIAKHHVWGSYTWSLAVSEPRAAGDDASEGGSGGESSSSEIWEWETADRGGG